MDIYGLIGALKSQFMYQNSKLKKLKKDGKDFTQYQFTSISPDDVLFLLVEELESAIKEVENIPSANDILVNITAKNIDFSILNQTDEEIIMPTL